MAQRKLLLLSVALVTVAIACIAIIVLSDSGERLSASTPPEATIPIAVLGDSDSHSFHDRTHFPRGADQRGGEYHSITFNWPEVLMRLRGDQIDLGEWRVWGPPNPIAKARELLGMPVRRPRKEDYQFNFAINGAGCKDLNHGWRQVDRLLAVMDQQSDRWASGIVISRIGNNSFGKPEDLEKLAANPDAPDVNAAMDDCIREIATMVDRVQARHPSVRLVLIGIFDNSNWPRSFDKWQNPGSLANIDRALERFDSALRGMEKRNHNVAFFSDRDWFRDRWGSRDPEGKPSYRTLTLPNGFAVTNSSGDSPSNTSLADGHAGTICNGVWASDLIRFINQRFATNITEIIPSDLFKLIEPSVTSR